MIYQQLIIFIVRETGTDENCRSYRLFRTGFINTGETGTMINTSSIRSTNLMILLAQLFLSLQKFLVELVILCTLRSCR